MNQGKIQCAAIELTEKADAYALIYSTCGGGLPLLGHDAERVEANADEEKWAVRPDLKLILGDESADVFDVGEDGFVKHLLKLLHARFENKLPGLVVLSSAAMEYNAHHLNETVIECAVSEYKNPEFMRWMVSENDFCSTLQDCAEWLIQADENVKKKIPLPMENNAIRCVDSLAPYYGRREMMLWGGKCILTVCAMLCGVESTGDAMTDGDLRTYLGKILTEDMPKVMPFERKEVLEYALQVCSYLENACGSEKWPDSGRNLLPRFLNDVLPVLFQFSDELYELPRRICFALSALVMLYAGVRKNQEGQYMLAGENGSLPVYDAENVLEAFSHLSCDMAPESLAYAALSDQEIWKCDLREINMLEETVTNQLRDMQLLGIRAAMAETCK